MSTTINSNGSKWAGESPDSIETLLHVLATETLDPTFEDYGNFAINMGDGVVRFWGNFYTVSHVFSIDTDDATMCATLTAAITANQATDAYKAAHREVKAHAATKAQSMKDTRRRMARR